MQCYHLPRRRVLEAVRSNLAVHTLSRRRYASSSAPPLRNSRWLSEVQKRLGKCITFGLRSESDLTAARRLSEVLGSSWKGLVAGAEGFSIETTDPALPHPIWPERVLWGEQDPMGHVNNATYLRYAETSRIWYFRRLAGLAPREYRKELAQIMRPAGIGLILKTVKVDFLLPLQYPDDLSLVHSLGPPAEGDPPSEINLRCWILSHKHQRVAARVEENVPLYDYRQSKKATLPSWLEEILARTRRAEEESANHWTSMRANVEGWLMGLEEATVNSGQEEVIGDHMIDPTRTHAGSTAPRVEDALDKEQAQQVVEEREPKVQETRLWPNKKSKPTWGVKR